jgi:hypothetical protein
MSVHRWHTETGTRMGHVILTARERDIYRRYAPKELSLRA